MNLKPVVEAVTSATGVADPFLVERDVRLHLLLRALLRREPLRDQLLFKGGTCLIKCFLGYPRFSADLDFTWRDQSAWADLGKQAGRAAIRPFQRDLIAALVAAAPEADLEFRGEKDVRYGRSNRMLTATVNYTTAGGLPSLVRLQVSFEEILLYPPLESKAVGLTHGNPQRKLAVLANPAAEGYSTPVPLTVYDPREILAEKVRAVLTRQAAKGRDILDLYLIREKLGLKVADFTKEVVTKTRFAIEAASRYKEHLDKLDDRLEYLAEEDLRPFLIKPIDMGAFEAYRRELIPQLKALASRLQTSR